MAKYRGGDSGREATALLATAFVVTIGLALCVGMIFVFPQDPRQPAMFGGGILLVFLVLMYLLRDKKTRPTNSASVLIWGRKPQETEPDYKPQLIKQPERRNYGGNEPPTAERLREIRAESNRWVPSSKPARESDDGR